MYLYCLEINKLYCNNIIVSINFFLTQLNDCKMIIDDFERS